MSDETPSNGQGEESFAALFEASQQESQGALKPGDKVKGRVISMDANTVFMDVGDKRDGVVDRVELTDNDGQVTVKEGDELDLYVVNVGTGGIKLSKALSGAGGVDMLRQAYESKLPVEARVAGPCKGGFNVVAFGRRAFCPASQMDLRPGTDPAEHTNKHYSFAVIKFEERGRNVVLSRRALLEAERDEAQKQFEASIQPGTELEVTVTRLAQFGAFAEVAPGVDGLIHVSELSWSRIDDPAAAVAVGDSVKVKVTEVGRDKKGRLKVSLSAKQAMPDPWTLAAGTFKEGQTVTGKVARLADFGAFVEIAPGIEGLVHVSEMSYVKRVVKPGDVVSVGDEVAAVIKEFDAERRRVGLSMRDAQGDPWAEVAEKYKPGQPVTGTVEKRESFGLFVNLEPGVTGLLPKSNIKKSEKPAELEKLAAGDSVTLLVENVSPAERRISLTPADAREIQEARERKDWKQHAPKQTTSGEAAVTSLADLLAEAQKNKK
ncbi:MAG: 30S ribosomal protein S1 [Thermodesulfobacteriota bacterium]